LRLTGPTKSDHFGSARGKKRRPRRHQFKSLFEQIPASIGRLGLVLDDVRNCGLADFAGKIRRSEAQSRNADRKPCTTRRMVINRTMFDIGFSFDFPNSLPADSTLARPRTRCNAAPRGANELSCRPRV
jgi:hypothetical protein